MEILRYLLLTNLFLLVFYAFYYAFLRRETFFVLNRIYLIGSAFLSMIIPIMNWTWLHQLFPDTAVVSQPGLLTLEKYLVIQPHDGNPAEFSPDWTITNILLCIYLLGVLFSLGRLIWQITVLKLFIQGKPQNRAFSFFNKIVIDEQLPEQQTILQHELIHVRQWHSADVIFFKLIQIINWFNPVTIAYKNAIMEVHEYLADHASTMQTDKSRYVKILLSHTFNIPVQQLSNNFFYEPLIKKRITMLNKTKSGKRALLKYGLSLPLCLVAVLVCSFSNSSKLIDRSVPVIVQDTDQIQLNELSKHISKVINYPKTAREARIVGKVVTSFKVFKGKIQQAEVLQGISDELDEEVLRSLNSYTGKLDAPDHTYTLIVAFELQKTGKEKNILKASALNIENLPNVLSEITVRGYYK